MTNILAYLVIMIFIAAIVIGIVAWARLLYYMYKTTTELRAGVTWSDVPFGFNRFNILFQPRFLSEKGLEYRRKTGKQLLWFLIPILLAFLLVPWAGIVKW